ncbi:MAG TPA: pyridine nucleotide-disulfide oxidoreductase [Gammaproteobacteria bacterium]|jgi:3-phenylpropionate/trans-cinnamate dioxygenase ferredoxin reductase subunit|nr:FAD-dependent oxidoreductase [Gammaproteobacteria bacterium]MDP6732023.1 FAD-dependent oxidoreductase [Gammaproteobacteria bacterium]HAJ76488.1 pyridine nucleotide-disulfide oxidoreductase [Gammaproteobacteria bacterium]
MSEKVCIVIGASHAGVSLALQLRKEGWDGVIKLIGAESELPYHRPPLSKEFLAGEKDLDAMRLRPARMFEDNSIELLLGTAVLKIDRDASAVLLDDGQTLHYDKLAMCTGALIQTIPLGATLENVFYIRTAADAAQVKEMAQPGKRAVIIGAGYIGLETAAVLKQRGLEVTVIEMADRILSRVTSERMSAYMTALHTSHGVEIKTSIGVTDIRGDSDAARITCDDGSEYTADFVIVGIGVVPNVGLAESAGLEIDEGVLVDEYACSSDLHIYAAGDCTCHPSAIFKRLIRLESVQNANDQARVAAANICGKQTPYEAVPWFWSDQYQVKLQMTGLSSGFDEEVCRGDPANVDETGFALYYLQDSRVIAVECVNRPKEFMAAKQLVKSGQQIPAASLADESVSPAEIVAALQG